MLARMKRLPWMLAAVCLLLFLVAGSAGAADYRLKLHHTLPPVAPAHTRMLVPWAERVEAQSGGRLAIDVYPAGQLGGQMPQLLDQARDGVVDIVWAVTGATPGRFPRIRGRVLAYLRARYARPTAGERARDRRLAAPILRGFGARNLAGPNHLGGTPGSPVT